MCEICTLLPPANEVWGKVMFSQEFICPGAFVFPVCIIDHMTSIQGGLHPRVVCIQGLLPTGGLCTLPQIHWIQLKHLLLRLCTTCHYQM